MIKHIVCWNVKDEAEGKDKAALMQEMKTRLEALVEAVPQLQAAEVGINHNPDAAAMDVVLVSAFASREDLDVYQVHPAHQEVVAFIKSVVTGRIVVDYEI